MRIKRLKPINKPEIIVRYMQEEKKEILWEIMNPILVLLTNGDYVTIPRGFVTDFASVPKIFWSVVSSIGKFNLAAIIHDYIYTEQPKAFAAISQMKYDRKFADDEFLAWMHYCSPDTRIRNYIMYYAVRIFGQKRWNYYAKNKSK